MIAPMAAGGGDDGDEGDGDFLLESDDEMDLDGKSLRVFCVFAV